MPRTILAAGLLILAAIMFVSTAHANGGPVPGAIFTTEIDGTEVNFNIYPSKDLVYLNGGPGPGAPEGAAGLPDGDYVFMVTDPSGKTLLSTDIAACRQFQVTGGDITSLITTGCPNTPQNPFHFTHTLPDGAITVQLLPYADTPNRGGEYKVWATPYVDFPHACLATADCGSGTHGFTPGFSKTDNFKVKVSASPEIDARFYAPNQTLLDNLGITWIDTNGASNNKWTYYNESLDVIHEAHVEAPEEGTHTIVVGNQPGCTVGKVYLNDTLLPNLGPQSVSVKVPPTFKSITLRVDVYCQ